ncbi:hypothetical protein V6N11_072834 [Hibiscus sabdariffa]|uniref:WAT1-related protein n=1 Tax=Hibiscus sabdariffa TaxID=183260 RepID=A0ABR1ZHB9_9ROSI
MFISIHFMIVSQAINAWLNIFYGKSYSMRASMTVLIAYRFLIASIFFTLVAIYFDRGFVGLNTVATTFRFASVSSIPTIAKLGLKITYVLAIIFWGLVGQNTFAASFRFAFASSIPTIAKLGPAITYILAIIFRHIGIETLTLYTLPGRAKADLS